MSDITGAGVSENSLNVHNVLNPKLIWIDGACVRVNRKKALYSEKKLEQPHKVMKVYDEEDDCEDDCDYEIEVTENGRYKTGINLPKSFFSYIIGTKGSRRKKIEEETNSQIIVPKQNDKKDIIITGPTERSVAHARRRLELIAIELRDKHQITHFISFPMISDDIKNKFSQFKEQLLADKSVRGMEESIFQNTNKLHLTIGTLVLLDEEECDEASEILESCKMKVVDPLLNSYGPFAIRMKGLQYMNDDPSNVDVLYAKVEVASDESSLILQEISDKIFEYFCKEGLVKKEYDKVKLHVTLINTRYRKSSEQDNSKHKRYGKRITFDARPILEKYADYDFGVQEFTSIHLSDRFQVSENGYYGCVYSASCV